MSEQAAEIPADIPADTAPETSIETDIEASSEAESSETEGNEGEGQEELQEALEEQIKLLKLKVDGEEFEEELPFEVSKEQAEWLQKELQLARASQKRMQEAAELRKKDTQTQEELQGFFQALKENPMAVLESMGVNTKEISEARLQEEIKKLEMTEEEREIAELKQKLKDHEEKEQTAKKQKELEEQERLKNQYAAEYEKDLMNAIDNSNLPKNPEIIQRLAQYMHTALQLGIDVGFQDLIPMVHDSIRSDMSKLLGSLPVDEIMGVLGDENIQKIMAKKGPKVTKKAPPSPKDIQDTSQTKEKPNPFAPKYKTKSMKDFFGKL